MSARDIFQASSIVLIVASLVYVFLWSRRDKTRFLWSVPVAVWLLHGLVFYTVVLINSISPFIDPNKISLGDWGAVVRVHGYLTVLQIIFELNKLNGKVDHHAHH